MDKVEIMGVRVDRLTLRDVLVKCEEFIKTPGQHYIVTPNPEFIVAAQRDSDFKTILNQADLAVADGTGLVFAAKFLGGVTLRRVPGVDLMWSLCALAANRGYTVYFLGAQEGVAEAVAEKLHLRFPNIQIVGAESGGDIKRQVIIDEINSKNPQILFVAFGHPKQEKWIASHLAQMPSVKLAMGVGGAFDFIAGRTRRAPNFFRLLGLEWLYRLFREPWRLRRIWRAVVVFPAFVIKDYLKARNSKSETRNNI